MLNIFYFYISSYFFNDLVFMCLMVEENFLCLKHLVYSDDLYSSPLRGTYLFLNLMNAPELFVFLGENESKCHVFLRFPSRK